MILFITTAVKTSNPTMGWEIINCPPYSPDSAPSDFNLFGPRRTEISK
jgi:hypothetical protein